MAFANLMVWKDKEREVQEKLNTSEEAIREYAMKFNIKKYDYMFQCRELGKVYQHLVLRSDKMKSENNLKYPGSLLKGIEEMIKR